ncbi:MAG: thioredoxin [Lachnospiraceae bacterium]|nr:thioredoxin [Lachnospiraceae bacterium]
MSALAVNSSNFEEEVLKADVPVLVDFWATWCGPCKMLSPIIAEIASEADGFKVCSVDVDEEQDLAMTYEVSAIPTLLVFQGGKVVNRSVGFIPKAQVLALVKG